MSLRGWIIQKLLPANSTYANPDDWMWETFAGRKTASGERVNERNALQLSAVWACVRVISENIASLPLDVYRNRPDGGKDKLTKHPLQTLIHDAPNPDMTAMVFRETLQAHVLTWGNGYAEIVRNGGGRPVELWPMNPAGVTPKRTDDGSLYYHYRDENGKESDMPPSSVLHIPGLGFDGVCGYSPIRMARESMGLTSGAEKFGAALFGNGVQAGGVLEHPGKLSDPAYDRLKKDMADERTGAANAHKTFILEEGMKWSQSSINPDDAQFLETRKFQTEEIARWYNVPLHMIQHLEKATFSNIEHQGINFVVYTMRPWLVKSEQEIKRKLFMPSERDLFAEHKIDGLLRGDVKSRNEAYGIAIMHGLSSPNEVRSLENQNPYPAGDVYLAPLNMTTMDKIGEDTEPSTTTALAYIDIAAERVARKEAAFVTANYHDPDAVKAFYDKHAEFVAKVMLIGIEEARQYTADTFAELEAGADIGSGFEEDRRLALVALATAKMKEGVPNA